MTTDFTLCEQLIVAASEAWRGNGELVATGIGPAPRLAAGLAKLTHTPELMMTDGEAYLVEDPVPLAVTVLTSDGDAPAHILPKRVELAVESGARGLVCAGPDLGFIRNLVPRFTLVVPGTRPEGVATHDQARTCTPAEALGSGADILVIGRAVTQAADPAKAAEALVDSLA